MRTYFSRRPALATAAVAGLSGGTAQAESAPVVVKTARNAKLHHTVLVNRAGHTLYALSAERNGRFICTDDECRSFWTPLTVRQDGRGDANGEGFKDVGTWHAVVPSGR